MRAILYVDDQLKAQGTQSRLEIWRGQGLTIHAADTFEMADSILADAERLDIGVLIVDLIMPPERFSLDDTLGGTLSGLAWVRHIRREGITTPVIFMSVAQGPSTADLHELRPAEFMGRLGRSIVAVGEDLIKKLGGGSD